MKRPAKRNPSDLERALAGDKNLQGANLQHAYLENVNLEGADLEGAKLAGANLRSVNLSEANLQGADLRVADLDEINLEGANLYNANLYNANLKYANLKYANLEGAYLFETDLSYANLRKANLYKANLEAANLTGANVTGANLENANLENANLPYANLNFANLQGAYFLGADLEGANLGGANLQKADLQNAYLSKANLQDANLAGANLEGANLEGANLEGTKLPAPEVQVLPVAPTSDTFYRWFGESKIVNADGSPRVLYHGTDKAGFAAFSLEKIDKWHPGFFFADTPELAKTYTASRQLDPFAVDRSKGIYRVYVKMERPFVYDCKGAYWNKIPFEGKKVKTDDIGHWAKKNDYDGAILLNVIDEGQYGTGLGPQTVYIVFDPKNIKSATYNVGTWDPNDPDIRHNPLRRLKVYR